MAQPESESFASSLQWTRENLGTSVLGAQAWQDCVVFNLYGDPTVTLANPPETLGAVFGTVREDPDGDGILLPTETESVAGATVFVDENGNGSFDFGEPYTLSDSRGRYAIGGLEDGEYSIAVVLSEGYLNVGSRTQEVTIAGGVDVLDVDFAGFVPRSIVGSVFLDVNENEIRDAGEQGLGGVTVFLDAALDQYDAVTTTDAGGYYSFAGLPQGSYTLSHEVPGGCEPIGDLQRTAEVADADVITVDLPDRAVAGRFGSDIGLLLVRHERRWELG